jgi:hypothetical protein
MLGNLCPYFLMQSLQGEDAQLVYDFIVSVVNGNGLDFSNLISFCADNAPVNFGGPNIKARRTCSSI